MSSFTITRTDHGMPADMEAVSDFLFKVLDGVNRDDRRSWRKFWKRIRAMAPGDLAKVEMRFPRSGPFHRRHFSIINAVFDYQEMFQSDEQFLYWVKIGAAWVDWLPTPGGALAPIPRSISYASADQAEFEKYHEAVMQFFRGGHAARFLWPHLGDGADEMMEAILMEYDR